MPHILEPLFNPKSIAVIGASADENKAGNQVMASLKDFPGKLYPVNPNADTILGFKAFPSINEIPENIDLAILTIPANKCPDAIEAIGKAGTLSAMIVSGGFSESGSEGNTYQQKIFDLCRTYRIRLLGPNTAGFVNIHSKISANFVPWIKDVKEGNIGLVSQSGAMVFTIASLLHTRNLGISMATSIGNGIDVDIEDAVEYLAQHEQTQVILVYVEGIKNGRSLLGVIRNTVFHKPVVVLTIGQGDVSDFAASHTGNMMGSYQLKRAAFSQVGAVIADTVDEMVDAAALFSSIRLKPKNNPGIGILTGQAGPCMVIADFLKSRGVCLPELKQETIRKIQKYLPMSYIKNPVDTTRPGPSFIEILFAIADDPGIDAIIIFAIHEPAVIDPVELFKGIKDRVKKPVLFSTAGFPESISPAIDTIKAMGFPTFTSPDCVARATFALVRDSRSMNALGVKK